MKIVFKSVRINYVTVTEELIKDYLEMVNNKELADQIGIKIVCTEEDEKEWVKIKKEEPCFSMIEKETGAFIGNVEIMNIKDGEGEVGISITPKMQNNHFGTEAMERIMEYAYEELKLNQLYLNVFKTNKRAIHCYEKVGFVIAGDGNSKEEYKMVHQR